MNTSLGSYNLSFWEEEAFFRDIDALIIGSGLVGLSAAISLREQRPDWRVVVLERGPLPIGASTRNAGFACFGSMTELMDDLTQMPAETVWEVVAMRWRGLQLLRKRLGDRRLGYREYGGFEVFRSEEQDVREQCLAHLPDFNYRLRDITGLPQVFQPADERITDFKFNAIRWLIRNGAEGQLHTGNMMKALLAMAREKGVEVYNGIEIARLEEAGSGVLLETTAGWSIRAERLLVATNGFAGRLLPELQVEPARNQVLVTEPIPGLAFQGCFHYDRGYFYFRNLGERILLGGGRQLAPETEHTDELGSSPLIRGALVRLLREVILPGREAQVQKWWSGILGVGAAKAPIVRRLSERLTVAVRLGGMGVAIGSQMGEKAACLLTEKP